MAVRIKCADCGTTDVTRDAWAAWDEVAQAWVLGAIFDDGFCHRCEREASLAEEPVLTVIAGGAGPIAR
jgi:hypothetical protein